MNPILRALLLVVIVTGLYSGTRYIGSVIRYGCANPVPLLNVEGGDDCPPPFYAAGRLAWFITGDSLVPLWNRDASAVQKVDWTIDQSAIGANVTFKSGTTQHYDLGAANACVGNTDSTVSDHARYFGRAACGTSSFAAFNRGTAFHIERYDVSTTDGRIATTSLLEI